DVDRARTGGGGAGKRRQVEEEAGRVKSAGLILLSQKATGLWRGDSRSVRRSYCVIIFCRLYVAGLAPQQGHRGRIPMSALINRTRTVAIEFGMWRSGRKGGSSGSITFG